MMIPFKRVFKRVYSGIKENIMGRTLKRIDLKGKQKNEPVTNSSQKSNISDEAQQKMLLPWQFMINGPMLRG